MKLVEKRKLKEMVFPTSMVFTQFVKYVVNFLEEQNIDYCVIGGIALHFYDYTRATTDLDLLIDRPLSEVQRLFVQAGYKKTTTRGVFSNKYPDFEVEFLTQGERLTPNGLAYPDPKQVRVQQDYFGKKIWVISLKELIHAKLGAYVNTKTRMKDGADVQELIKSNLGRVEHLHFPEPEIETAWKTILKDTIL